MTMPTEDPVVLMVLARDPSGRRTGRINVLETAARGLRAAGATVHVAAVAAGDGPDRWADCSLTRIGPPGLARVLVNLAGSVTSRRSLNELVLDSSKVRSDVAALARSVGAQVVVADTLRTWRAAKETGLPVIAHLDDLVSDRYTEITSASSGDPVLGYFGERIPTPLRAIAEGVVRRLLPIEAKRARRREVEVARQAAVPALTGADEAAILSARSGVTVQALPMSVDVRPPGDVASSAPGSAVFLGGLDYSPNLAALRWWRDEVLPLLRARGAQVRVDVVGFADEAHQAALADPDLTFLGYVDDLAESLRGHRMFISPIQSGTGVKTKVLDGMSVALPVVATPLGVAGIPVRSGVDALVATSPADFADHVLALAADADLAARIGNRGRALLDGEMSSDILDRAWRSALDRALEAHR